MSDDSVTRQEVEDIDIALRMMDGDESALTLLLEVHGPSVRGTLFGRYVRTVPASVLDDALNRAAYTVWRKADQFDDRRGSLGGWMAKIAIREVSNILREGRRNDEILLEDLTEFSEPERTDFELSPERAAQLRAVKEIIDSLPRHQKVITEMDLASGCDADNALLAEILGTSRASIYVSRVKAREKIEEEMKRRGHFR